MNLFNKIQRLKKLNNLIDKQKTGTPNELAKTLGISRSKLYELIDLLTCLGKNIHYSRKTGTFYYTDESKLEIEFSVRLIKDDEIENIYGGVYLQVPYFFMDRTILSLIHH